VAAFGLSSALTGSTLDGSQQLDGYLVTPTSWVASAYFYIPAGSLLVGRTVALSLEGGTSSVVTAVTSVPANLAQGQWVRASLLFTLNNLPTTTPAFVARLSGTLSSAVGQKIYTDGWLVEKTTTAKGWFDGSSTVVDGFTSVTSAAWNGVANESSSTMTGLPNPYGDTTYSTLNGTNALV
jgi:hypothetical protein